MLDLFKRATASALATIGESAVLRASVPCQVNVEEGVMLSGLDTEFEAARDTRNMATVRAVATISAEVDPKVGDALSIGKVGYRLDTLLEDAGPFRRFVLLKVNS